jgi:hypothetical protein
MKMNTSVITHHLNNLMILDYLFLFDCLLYKNETSTKLTHSFDHQKQPSNSYFYMRLCSFRRAQIRVRSLFFKDM